MIQSKAIDILKSLSKKEIAEFDKYLNSPYLNSNKKLVPLYRYLIKFYPGFESDKLTKESVYRVIYPESNYNDSRRRKLLSDLYKEAEKFIVINSLGTNTVVFTKLLLDEFDSRKLDHFFLPKIEAYNIYLDNNQVHYDYYLEKHLAEWKNVMFHLERGMQHKIAMNVYSRTEYLVFYFLSDFLLSMHDNLSNTSRFNTYKENDLGREFLNSTDIDKLFAFIDKHDYPGKNVLKSYYLAYLAFKNIEDLKFYYEYKKFVLKHIASFNEGTRRTVIIHLINYCVRRKRTDKNIEIRKELNDNYELYIKYGLYKISGENYFRSDLFLNIISVFFESGRINEAYRFLEKNIDILQPSHRKNIRSLCSALIEFEKGNFGESLRNSMLIKTNTFLYKYRIKHLNLKNHYELNNYDIAREALNSFRKFINSDDTLSEEHKNKYWIFINFYNQLWNMHENSAGKNVINDIIEKIDKQSPFPEDEWLKKKFLDLSRKKAGF